MMNVLIRQQQSIAALKLNDGGKRKTIKIVKMEGKRKENLGAILDKITSSVSSPLSISILHTLLLIKHCR